MRDSFTCKYCGKAMNPLSDELTLDHVNPNGNTTEDNLVTACAECNMRKGTKPVEDFKAQLIHEAQQRLDGRRRLTRTPLEIIAKQVTQELMLKPGELLARSRHREAVEGRMQFSVVARKEGYSYPEIGRYLQLHHTTVVHMCQKFESTSYAQSVPENREISTEPTASGD
jgi:chromosomal replication initiation ATPase DnaA